MASAMMIDGLGVRFRFGASHRIFGINIYVMILFFVGVFVVICTLQSDPVPIWCVDGFFYAGRNAVSYVYAYLLI